MSAAFAAGQDPGWAAPQIEELKATEDSRPKQFAQLFYTALTADVLEQLPKASCNQSDWEHLPHGWREHVPGGECEAPLYHCEGHGERP